jgi:hypothetical protein
MKLNPDALVVSSFQTGGGDELNAAAGTHSPVCPTPMTQCFVCPVETYTCA